MVGAYYIGEFIIAILFNREIKFSITAIAGVSSPNCGDEVEVRFLFMAHTTQHNTTQNNTTQHKFFYKLMKISRKIGQS